MTPATAFLTVQFTYPMVCIHTRACGPHFHILPPSLFVVHFASVGVN